MSFSDRIRQQREKLGLRQAELGKRLGVTGSAIGNYENGVSTPKGEVLYRLFDVLQCDANTLFQDEIHAQMESPVFSPDTLKLAKQYESLDEYGASAVRAVLTEELRRVEAANRQVQSRPDEPQVKIIPLFGASFAAGPGQPDFGNAWEEYPIPIDTKADFAIRISGDSMEPWLPDGSIALGIRAMPQIGEIVAVMVDGDNYVKQYCQDSYGNLYLFSLNRKRRNLDLEIKASGDRSVKIWGVIKTNRRFSLPID